MGAGSQSLETSVSLDSSLFHFDILKARKQSQVGIKVSMEAVQEDHKASLYEKPSSLEPPRKSHPRILGRRIADKVKTTTQKIAVWVDNIHKGTDLWCVLALENIPMCRKIRKEFINDANYPLFYDAQTKLVYPIFQDFTLVLLNLANETSSKPSKNETVIIFEPKSPSVGYMHPASSVMPAGNGSESHVPIQSILKGTAHQNYTKRVLPKEFKHEICEERRDELRAQMYTRAETCQYRLVVLKMGLNPENGSEMIKACADCFDFIGKTYAAPLKAQMVEYMTHIVDLRKHMMMAFDTLRGTGHQFAKIFSYKHLQNAF